MNTAVRNRLHKEAERRLKLADLKAEAATAHSRKDYQAELELLDKALGLVAGDDDEGLERLRADAGRLREVAELV